MNKRPHIHLAWLPPLLLLAALGCKPESVVFEERDAQGECAETCENDRPRCDRDSGLCVECLAASDCRQDLFRAASSCEAGECVYTCESLNFIAPPAGSIEEDGCSCEVSEELCDGRDNDCDGEIDEGVGAVPCEKDVGVCQGATFECAGELAARCEASSYEANALALAMTYEEGDDEGLRCDGQDNDCDGEVDEACCAPSELPSRLRLLDASLPGSLRIIAASPASEDASFAISYLEDTKTFHLIEFDQSLRPIRRGSHTFPQRRLESVSVVPVEEGYALVLNSDFANAPVPGGEVALLAFYRIEASRLSESGAASILSGVQAALPFSFIELNSTSRISNVDLIAHGSTVLTLLTANSSLPNINSSLLGCVSQVTSFGSSQDECVRSYDDVDEAFLYWENKSGDAFSGSYEVISAFRGPFIVWSWNRPALTFQRSIDLHIVNAQTGESELVTLEPAEGRGVEYARVGPYALEIDGQGNAIMLFSVLSGEERYHQVARVRLTDPEPVTRAQEQLATDAAIRHYLDLVPLGESSALFFYQPGEELDPFAIEYTERDLAAPFTALGEAQKFHTSAEPSIEPLELFEMPWGTLALIQDSGAVDAVRISREGGAICESEPR